MARKLRLVFPGACYHVINRGNYRRDVFAMQGAAAAFEATMLEAVRRCSWQLHAYVVMRNHYHLAITTPEPNLVEGVQWLQSTFATRFNRYRDVRGHLFQGRYKALLVEPGASLVRLVDYIHLNPARAGVVGATALHTYPWSSLKFLAQRQSRPTGLEVAPWLRSLGHDDNTSGLSWYLDRLLRLASDERSQSHAGLRDLSVGWAIGTDAWRKAIAEEHARTALGVGLEANEVRELRERKWARILEEALRRLGRTSADLVAAPKGAPWKVEIAQELRRLALAPNRWIAKHLNMGHPNSISSLCGRRATADPKSEA